MPKDDVMVQAWYDGGTITLLHRRGHHHTAQADDNHHSGPMSFPRGMWRHCIFRQVFVYFSHWSQLWFCKTRFSAYTSCVIIPCMTKPELPSLSGCFRWVRFLTIGSRSSKYALRISLEGSLCCNLASKVHAWVLTNICLLPVLAFFSIERICKSSWANLLHLGYIYIPSICSYYVY